MYRVYCWLIGYAFGCIQSAYIVSKIFGKIDIREHGSGNAGTTNVIRVMGLKAGIAVFIIDVLKASVAVFVASWLFNGSSTFTDNGQFILPGLYAGIGAVMGHNFPFYLDFKGGKGIACSFGVIMSINATVGLYIFIAGFLVIIVTKYISAASLTGAVLFPVFMYIDGTRGEALYLCIFLSVLAIYQHRENIERLATGTESKFSIKKK